MKKAIVGLGALLVAGTSTFIGYNAKPSQKTDRDQEASALEIVAGSATSAAGSYDSKPENYSPPKDDNSVNYGLSSPEAAVSYVLDAIITKDKNGFKQVSNADARDMERTFSDLKNVRSYTIDGKDQEDPNSLLVTLKNENGSIIRAYIDFEKQSDGNYLTTGLGLQ